MTFQQQKGEEESPKSTDMELDPSHNNNNNKYIRNDNKVVDYEEDFTGHFQKKFEEAMNFVQSSEKEDDGEEEEDEGDEEDKEGSDSEHSDLEDCNVQGTFIGHESSSDHGKPPQNQSNRFRAKRRPTKVDLNGYF